MPLIIPNYLVKKTGHPLVDILVLPQIAFLLKIVMSWSMNLQNSLIHMVSYCQIYRTLLSRPGLAYIKDG